MALQLTKYGYEITIDKYESWTLEDAIKHGTHDGLDKLEFYCDSHGQGGIYRAERDEQNPPQFVAGCIKCGHSTPHTVEHGCTACAAYRAEETT